MTSRTWALLADLIESDPGAAIDFCRIQSESPEGDAESTLAGLVGESSEMDDEPLFPEGLHR